MFGDIGISDTASIMRGKVHIAAPIELAEDMFEVQPSRRTLKIEKYPLGIMLGGPFAGDRPQSRFPHFVQYEVAE